MSNIFLTNKIKEILAPSSTMSESISVSKLLGNATKKENKFITSTTINNIDDATSSASVGGNSNKVFSATSSSINNKQSGGAGELTSATSPMVAGATSNVYSATSILDNATSPLLSNQVQQGGKGFSATSSVVNKKSSGDKSISDVDHLISMLTSETSDANSVSTNKLENDIKNMLNNNNNMVGGQDASVNTIKNFFTTLRDNGMNVNIKLDDLTLTEFFDNGGNIMVGGARSLPPALVAFQKLKKMIAEELGITGRELITKASKIASAVKKDALDEGVEPAKHFKDNKDKYKKLYQKM
jgi:hypothetical protein